MVKKHTKPHIEGHFWVPRILEFDADIWGRTTPKAVDKSRPAYCHGMAFMHLLSLMAFKVHTTDNCGGTQVVGPGQVVRSISQLGERLNWSDDAVRCWLLRLKKAGKISWNTPPRRKQRETPKQITPNPTPPGSETPNLFQYRRMTISLIDWEQYAAKKLEGVAETPELARNDPPAKPREEKTVLEEGEIREQGVAGFITKPDDPSGVRSLPTGCSRLDGPLPAKFDVNKCSTQLTDKLANQSRPMSFSRKDLH